MIELLVIIVAGVLVVALCARRYVEGGRVVRRALIAEAAHEEYSADLLLWDDELAGVV